MGLALIILDKVKKKGMNFRKITVEQYDRINDIDKNQSDVEIFTEVLEILGYDVEFISDNLFMQMLEKWFSMKIPKVLPKFLKNRQLVEVERLIINQKFTFTKLLNIINKEMSAETTPIIYLLPYINGITFNLVKNVDKQNSK